MDAKKLRAKDFMQTDVKTVHKGVTLLAATKMMRDFGLSSLVVEPDDDGDAFGIITRKDIVEAIVMDANGWESLTVDDLMTKPSITTNSSLSISHCYQLMRMVGVRRLPVVDGTNLVGILSNSDIFVKLTENIF
ncbi:MAG: CBS domain-containing protein [Deltaproteobacteria bacterium]|nr:CBS domain-containing protein [Deltaproteobacteria bacterium]MBW2643303.1 CBS domain-containing protein [Deltaproteobacteria bacterium]